MKNEHDLSRLASMIYDVRYPMMTTVDADGFLYSRPMASLKVDPKYFDGRLWFFTKLNSPKVQSLNKDQHVNLAYTHIIKQHYVSISGTGTLVTDRNKMKELWVKDFKEWFPEGLDDPELALICVTVRTAEIWDSTGRITHFVEQAKTFVTGKKGTREQGHILKLSSSDEARDDQNHVMSEDEKLDQAVDESFPASDPPGYSSKSSVDRTLH